MFKCVPNNVHLTEEHICLHFFFKSRTESSFVLVSMLFSFGVFSIPLW